MEEPMLEWIIFFVVSIMDSGPQQQSQSDVAPYSLSCQVAEEENQPTTWNKTFRTVSVTCTDIAKVELIEQVARMYLYDQTKLHYQAELVINYIAVVDGQVALSSILTMVRE
jgi:hypothetical protein